MVIQRPYDGDQDDLLCNKWRNHHNGNATDYIDYTVYISCHVLNDLEL